MVNEYKFMLTNNSYNQVCEIKNIGLKHIEIPRHYVN